MGSPVITPYDHAWKLIAGPVDLLSDPISVRLVTSGYTPSAAHTVWDNGAGNSTDPSYRELADGSGYTTGGKVLANVAVTSSVISFDDVSWPSLTATFRYALLVANGTYLTLTDPLLAWILLDDAPADIVSSGADYQLLLDDTNGLVYQP